MIFRLKSISKDLTKHIEDAAAKETPSTTPLSSAAFHASNIGKFKNNKFLNSPSVGKINAVAPDITIINNITSNVVKKDEDSKVPESVREKRVVSIIIGSVVNNTGKSTFQNLLSIVKSSG